MSPYRLAVVVGSPSPASRTKLLAQALADAVATALPVRVQLIELATLAPQLLAGGEARALAPAAQAALQALAQADLVIAATPVYKGSYTGLFKHLFDLLDPEALVGRPVLLAATGGSDRHALVVDHQLRPLFAFFRALSVPSAVYASPADLSEAGLASAALQARIGEAAAQAVALLRTLRPRAPAAPQPGPARATVSA